MSNNTKQQPSKLKVNCPTCKNQVEWNDTAKYRPFCSDRCQKIDLGAWASDEYAIATEPDEEWSGDSALSSPLDNVTWQ